MDVCYLTGLILIAMHCIQQLFNRSMLRHMKNLQGRDGGMHGKAHCIHTFPYTS